MLVYEYKLDGTKKQFQAIEEAIRTAQFIRNTCLRLWMDGKNVSKNDLQTYCAVLAKEYPFASRLNSQASPTVVSMRERRGFDSERGRSGPKLGESVAKQTTQRDTKLEKA